jgi:hypothetical protein
MRQKWHIPLLKWSRYVKFLFWNVADVAHFSLKGYRWCTFLYWNELNSVHFSFERRTCATILWCIMADVTYFLLKCGRYHKFRSKICNRWHILFKYGADVAHFSLKTNSVQ